MRQAFADDISAVIEQEASDNIILVGHSLGGSIVASVAKNNPEKTLGIIGVDTIEGTGHFPMLEKPREFNTLLSKAIHDIHNFKP